MRFTRYSRYSPTDAEGVDLDELLSQLADYLLQSGFDAQFLGIHELDTERTLEQLRQAILEALEANDMLPAELQRAMQENPEQADELLNQFLQNLMERMMEEGHIRVDQPPPRSVRSLRDLKLDGKGGVRWAGAVAECDDLVEHTSVAADDVTLAITVPDSHHVFLLARG